MSTAVNLKATRKRPQMQLPLLPLRGVVVFPSMVVPLDVGRDKSVNALEEAMVKDKMIILAAQYQAGIDNPLFGDIYPYGTIEVKQLLKLPDGTLRVLVEGLCRVQIIKYLQTEPYYRVLAGRIEETREKSAEDEALMRTVLTYFEEYVKKGKNIPTEVLSSVRNIGEPGRLADIIAAHLNLKIEDKQKIPEAISPGTPEKICAIIIRELEVLEVERKIQLRVRKQMEKSQKEYYLREQIKAIQKELGDQDDRLAEINEYQQKIKEQDLPEEVREKALREVRRLEKMPPMAAEAVVVRNYLDWLLALPWNIYTEDHLDLEAAQRILDEDHYGLER